MSDGDDPADKLASREWSEGQCEKISNGDFFPSSVTDLSVQKLIITRFLNCYLGARGLKGLSVADLVFAVLSIMPVSPYKETIIWNNDQFRENGTLFFLSPEDKILADIHRITEHSHESSSIPSSLSETELSEENIDVDPNINSNLFEDFSNDLFLDNLHSLLNEPFEYKLSNNDFLFNFDVLEQEHQAGNTSNATNNDDDEIQATNSRPSDVLLSDVVFEPKPTELKNEIINYGPVENAAFVKYCNTALDKWDTDENLRATLKSFFAVVALVLMRATVKGYKHLVSTFHGQKFLRFLLHPQKVSPDMKYSPPHKRCLKNAFRTFCRKDKNTLVMFAKLVCVSYYTKEKYMKYVLQNGLLNYTADFGFNLVYLWRSIQTAVSREGAKGIIELTTVADTEASWERLTAFLIKYKSPGSKKYFYHWARILDPRFFKELSCQMNYKLAVILAVFADKITGNASIWESVWVQNENLESFRELGEKLYKQYLSLYLLYHLIIISVVAIDIGPCSVVVADHM